jgi:sulfonate transport system permease protein
MSSLVADRLSGPLGPRARRYAWSLPPRWLSPILLLIVWEFASRIGLIPTRVLSAPSTVVAAGIQLIASGELQNNLLVSLARAAGLSRAGEAIIDPLMQIKRTLPVLALVPLFIVWFGIGETPKIVLIAVATIFPVYLNLFTGIRSADVKLVEAGRSVGLTPFELTTQVILPGALPSLFTGLRYASAVALLVLVVAEQINASSGIGYLINNARDFLRTDIIVLCLLVYAMLGLASDAGVRWLERRVLAWRPSFLETRT